MAHTPDSLQVLALRSRVLSATRGFFAERGFLEVETPVRIPVPALELHIDAEPSGDCYLRTSPELHMKRLLCDGMSDIFQIGPCFRKHERGPLHSPEYCMLEWYRAGADYMDILADTRDLLRAVCSQVLDTLTPVCRGRTLDLDCDWAPISVRDAFLAHAGWDPVAEFDADRFDLDLVTKVEPALPRDRPVVLCDYPVQAAALARCRRDDPPVAERWELYLAGIELANAFSELTDAAEQRRRFEEWDRLRRAAGRESYPLDDEFLAALETGMPACGGAALGVDRLVMLLADRNSVDEVRPFRSPA